MQPTTLALSSIRIDGDTQCRATIDDATVAAHCHDIQAGESFPAITMIHDGSNYWLAAGFHRYHAYRKTEIDEVEVEVVRGTQPDAKWHSIGSNRTHGHRLTNADKRYAIDLALADAELAEYSAREIAAHVGVSHQTVSSRRRLKVKQL